MKECIFKNWNIIDIVSGCKEQNYAFMILNESIKDKKNYFDILQMWNKAHLKICVDGGTDEFFNMCKDEPYYLDITGVKNADPYQISLPNFISGDFDSVNPETLKYFKHLKVDIIETPNQDETDFTKALTCLGDYVHKKEIVISHALVLAGISSVRFDQTIGNLHTLYKMRQFLNFPVIIVSGKSLIWILEEGSHNILVPESTWKSKEHSWCGYAALGEAVVVSTKGLKWDVDARKISFDKMISTSNTYADGFNGSVTVECSGNLLWFMGWMV